MRAAVRRRLWRDPFQRIINACASRLRHEKRGGAGRLASLKLAEIVGVEISLVPEFGLWVLTASNYNKKTADAISPLEHVGQ